MYGCLVENFYCIFDQCVLWKLGPFYLIRVRTGVGSGCSLRGADFLQILDGAANDSIIWAGGAHQDIRQLFTGTKSSAQRKQILANSDTFTRPGSWELLNSVTQIIKRCKPINKLLHLAFAANTILPSVPNVAPCPEDLAPLFMFCQGWAGLG